MSLVRVQVPSSTTNLGPGFDALGVALNLYNRVELDELPWGLSIHVEGEGQDEIPRDESNICVEAVKRVYQKAGRTLPGLWMKQRNHIPLARGLGSSSAALVGGLVGANLLLGISYYNEKKLKSARSAFRLHYDASQAVHECCGRARIDVAPAAIIGGRAKGKMARDGSGRGCSRGCLDQPLPWQQTDQQ